MILSPFAVVVVDLCLTLISFRFARKLKIKFFYLSEQLTGVELFQFEFFYNIPTANVLFLSIT